MIWAGVGLGVAITLVIVFIIARHYAEHMFGKGKGVKMKYGRRTPKRTPSLKFANILKAIPDHPVYEDYLSILKNWQVLGNDTYGNCVAVAWANARRFTSALLGKEYYPTQAQVDDIYKTQNPGFPAQDDGMDEQSLLEYLNKNAGPDGAKLVAFASVDVNNLDEVKAALYVFGGILLGMDVQYKNIDDFNAGKVWDYHSGDSIDGGHGVLAGGYLGQSKNDVRFVTWGAETGMTDKFWSSLVDNANGEAWVLIWAENLGTKQFVQGIDMTALAADYQAITGRPLPVPAPTPTPTPTPTPVPPIPTPPAGAIAWLEKLFAWIIAILKAL